MADEEDLPVTLRTGLSFDLRKSIEGALARGAVGSMRGFVAFGKAVAETPNRNADMAQVHSRIAQGMRAATLAAYQEKVEGVRLVESYARPGRLAGGLGRALSDPTFAFGDARGISFAKTSVLRTEAAHWKRLNFGAGAAAGGAVERVPLRIFGRSLFNIGFRIQAQPGFSLPQGAYFSGAHEGGGGINSSTSQMHVHPGQDSALSGRPTRGIVGRHFLEAGVEYLAAELGPSYATLLKKWVEEGSKVAREELGKIKDNPHLA